jgi:putative ABC transport system substrate-binding protein
VTRDPARAARIGILDTGSADPARLALWDLFRERLRELGHGPGISLEFRWGEGRPQRLDHGVAELLAVGIDALVTAGTPAAAAASAATRNIPIVMATGSALAGAAGTLPGNVTGLSDLPAGLSARRLELLNSAIPGAHRFAILADRANPSSPPAVNETHDAARALGLSLDAYWLHGAGELDEALAAMRRDGVAGFVVAPGAMFFAERTRLAAGARAHRLAAMTVRRDYAEAGALMAYGAAIRDNYRQAAVYLDRILRGARPADLPVGELAQFELAINLDTARALGLVIPAALLAGAQAIAGRGTLPPHT